jgi:hypothetical protein
MTNTSLVIVFNHHYSVALNLVKKYNSRFSDNISIAAPFDELGVIRYSTGSYLWQGAIVEYLGKLENYEGSTLVIHDDLVLNSGLTMSDLASEDLERVRFSHTFKFQGDINLNWPWQFRVLTNWFTPKHILFGSGTDDVVEILKDSLLYKRNQRYIDSLEPSRLNLAQDHTTHELVKTWANFYFPNRTEFDFGLPLFIGNSDFFMFPNSYAPLIEDFLRRTLECGLFVEIAIPTLVEWLGLPIHFEQPRQLIPFGENYNMFQDLKSLDDIEKFFVAHPEVLSIHPVKFSKFSELLKDENHE